MDSSTSGKRVNERSAMQMTAVYSCVRILSEAVEGLPLHLYQYADKSSREKAVENQLYFLLQDEPDTEMTSFWKLKENRVECYFEKENIWTFDGRGELLLTAEGVPSPGGKPTWSSGTVKSILTNEKYKGDALLQKVYTVDFLTRQKKVNEGEVPQYYVENNHQAIISPSVFEEVQHQMAAGRFHQPDKMR